MTKHKKMNGIKKRKIKLERENCGGKLTIIEPENHNKEEEKATPT